MNEAVYERLAQVLDTLPNGFPRTETGVEIRLLKRIFEPEDAEMFCNLRLRFETSEQVAKRLGRPLEEVEQRLKGMWRRGQIFGVNLGGTNLYRMMPWAFGIYEFQLPHMDRELAQMCEEYMEAYGRQFFSQKPAFMHVVPVEREIQAKHEALPYERVSEIVEKGQDFILNQCICKKEQGLLDNPCSKPIEVCLAISPVPGVFKDTDTGRVIDRQEAYKVLEKSEEAGLVHLTWNVQNGHFFICNCCGCCCGVLRGINDLKIPATLVVNSSFYAQIDPELCAACGTCAEERCQVGAIEEGEEAYRILQERCIGCGLCVSTCPSEAVSLVRKEPDAIEPPPADEMAWYEQRAKARGVDFSAYK